MFAPTMLRVVTTNNVEVFRHLGSAAFQRLGVEHHVGSGYLETLELVRSRRPTLAMLDAVLADGSGFDLCRELKNDPAIAATHVIILLSSVITRAALEQIQASGCDDVLALPVHNDDFYHHVAQIAELPFRRDRRIGVSLEVLLPARGGVSGETVTGSVCNVSARGVGINIEDVKNIDAAVQLSGDIGPSGIGLENGQELTVRFRHEGRVFPRTPATLAWTRPPKSPGGGQEAGLEFGEVPIKTRILLEQLALFDVVPAGDDSPMPGGVTVALQGDFTEVTNFATLAERLAKEDKIDFDASAVRYISSAGVRGWCKFLAMLKSTQHYSFRHCSMAFTSQAAMVPMVVGRGPVLSLEAPYFCEACDREDLRLLETRSLLRDGEIVTPPQLSCSVCSGELEFDDVPERYFAFLQFPKTSEDPAN